MPLLLVIEANDIRLQNGPAEWKQLQARHLGTGYSGDGSKVLHDDMVWRPIGGSSGITGEFLKGAAFDCGTIVDPNSTVEVDLNLLLPVAITYGDF